MKTLESFFAFLLRGCSFLEGEGGLGVTGNNRQMTLKKTHMSAAGGDNKDKSERDELLKDDHIFVDDDSRFLNSVMAGHDDDELAEFSLWRRSFVN